MKIEENLSPMQNHQLTQVLLGLSLVGASSRLRKAEGGTGSPAPGTGLCENPDRCQTAHLPWGQRGGGWHCPCQHYTPGRSAQGVPAFAQRPPQRSGRGGGGEWQGRGPGPRPGELVAKDLSRGDQSVCWFASNLGCESRPEGGPRSGASPRCPRVQAAAAGPGRRGTPLRRAGSR